MTLKTKRLLVPAFALSTMQLFGANYSYTISQGDQVDLTEALGGIPNTGDYVTISGQSDSALSDSWVNIDADFGVNYMTINNGAVVKGTGEHTMTIGTSVTITNSAQGASSLVLGGTGDANRFNLTVMGSGGSNKDILIGCDTSAGSSTLELSGYVNVKATNRLDLGNGRNGSQIQPQGDAKLLVSGKYNNLSIYSFNIGQQWISQTDGSAIVEIVGSTHTLEATAAFRLTGGEGTSADNIVGGALSFVADADGISTLKVGATQALTGVILLDLREFVPTLGELNEFNLISYSGLQDTYQEWIDNLSETHFKAIGADNVGLEAREDGLYATYTAVPEPAAFAAVFGALALAFAAHRRR